MSRVADLKVRSTANADLAALRVDLAAAFRFAAAFDWHESVLNHFSLAVSDDGGKFLVNPRWKHFSEICASDLLLVDSGDAQTMARADAPDLSAWFIHGRIHARLPRARCVLHLHPPYATALSTLADPRIPPIDQVTAQFFNRIAIDHHYAVVEDQAEGDRIATALGSHNAMIMSSHGVLVIADTVALAFERLYYLERAARTLMLAYASGQPLKILPDHLAEAIAHSWENYGDTASAHFGHLQRQLDATDPSYRN